MPSFDIAHIREQDIDIIIVPLQKSFGNKSDRDQQTMISEFQAGAEGAGLAGTIVPV